MFAVLIGLLSVALSGYFFGQSDHTEQLPQVFRAIDPGYLTNDFFVNSASEFGPRFYFVRFIALVAAIAPVPAIYAALFVLTNVAVAAITAFAARDLTGSTIGGMVPATLAVSLTHFYLGNGVGLTLHIFIPQTIALPLSLFAIWRGARGEPVRAAVASLPAILMHPTQGVEMAAIALAAAVARHVRLAWPDWAV